MPRLIFQFFDAVDKEHEVGRISRSRLTTEVENAKLERGVNVGEVYLLILKIEQANETIRFRNRRKKTASSYSQMQCPTAPANLHALLEKPTPLQAP